MSALTMRSRPGERTRAGASTAAPGGGVEPGTGETAGTEPGTGVTAGTEPGGVEPGTERHDLYYRALVARDARFDGWFFTAVDSTGIYCRPSCPSITPRRDRVRFFATSAGAQRGGYRACKRCRPDASPGSPEWNRREDAVGRAMRSIADGVVDRDGVTGLAGRLGYSSRQLHRLLVREVGAGPLELARAQRGETARILLETTDLRAAEVAFAAGFGSVRQFNDTIRQIFGESPSEMRSRANRHRRVPATAAAGRAAAGRAAVGWAAAGTVSAGTVSAGTGSAAPGTAPPGRASAAAINVSLRLAYRAPFAASGLLAFLGERAVPGVEEAGPNSYRRALRLPHGGGVATVRWSPDGPLHCSLQLDDLRDLTFAVRRVRHMLDLDADPESVAEVLGGDSILGPSVAARPGLRIPGHVDGNELAIRAVLGQQVSVGGARTIAGRLAAEHGDPLASPIGSVVGGFPRAEVLAGVNPESLPMPRARARALVVLAEHLASGAISLEPGADRDEVSQALLALPGIGPWTVAYIRLRALGDPDSFMAGDLGVRRALERAGLPGDEASAALLARAWRPYRGYALVHLWSGPVVAPEKEA